MINNWKTPPQSLQLKEGDVHIWKASLELGLTADEWAKLEETLSAEEKARVRRLIKPQHRRRLRTSYVVLRNILSRYLNQPPHQLQFYQGPHGKPYLHHLPAEFELQFNMSHCEDVAVYALTLNREIGIDVEAIHSNITALELAERFFTPTEYHQLKALPNDALQAAFFRVWTRKEAYIKAIGKGLAFSLQHFEVSVLPGDMDCLLEVEGNESVKQQWSLGSLEFDEGYALAIALPGSIHNILRWQWSFSHY